MAGTVRHALSLSVPHLLLQVFQVASTETAARRSSSTVTASPVGVIRDARHLSVRRDVSLARVSALHHKTASAQRVTAVPTAGLPSAKHLALKIKVTAPLQITARVVLTFKEISAK